MLKKIRDFFCPHTNIYAVITEGFIEESNKRTFGTFETVRCSKCDKVVKKVEFKEVG